jgi:fructokinase
MTPSEILCVGEVLWDALPAGLFLGGAPFNVACHLRAAGLPVALASRVGADRLGDEAVMRAARYGVDTTLVQVDPTLPTGFVRVSIDAAGDAQFDILGPAAWDAIELREELLARAAGARAIVFGSLAQRTAITRGTIERLWDTEAMLVFDANLRPPYVDVTAVRRSLRHASVVKVTEAELRQLASWFDLAPAAPKEGSTPTRQIVVALVDTFGCQTVCVTRGKDGAAMWRDGRWTEHPGFEVEVRDTVGAGDAFLAIVLAGLLGGADDRSILQHATLIGAYVATQLGAVPADQPALIAPTRDSGAEVATRSSAGSPRVAARPRGTRATPPTAPRRAPGG